MDLSKIKNFIKQTGDKFILLENGEPELVVMPFKEYERLLAHGLGKNTAPSSMRPSIISSEDLVSEARRTEHARNDSLGYISSALEQENAAMTIASPIGLPMRLEDIRLEDLPI